MSRASAMQFDDLAGEFQRGVDDYFAGKVPDEWDGPNGHHDPYLAGWNIAAECENGTHFFAEDEEEYEEDPDNCEHVGYRTPVADGVEKCDDCGVIVDAAEEGDAGHEMRPCGHPEDLCPPPGCCTTCNQHLVWDGKGGYRHPLAGEDG